MQGKKWKYLHRARYIFDRFRLKPFISEEDSSIKSVISETRVETDHIHTLCRCEDIHSHANFFFFFNSHANLLFIHDTTKTWVTTLKKYVVPFLVSLSHPVTACSPGYESRKRSVWDISVRTSFYAILFFFLWV